MESKNNLYLYVISLSLILFVFMGEIVVYVFSIKSWIEFNILHYRFNNYDNTLTLKYTIRAKRYPSRITIMLLSTTRKVTDKSIYIYYDPDYQKAEIDKKKILVIINFLKYELKIRGYKSHLKVINAIKLKDILLDKSNASNSIIIIPTGAFPENVYSRYINFVKPWVKYGGTLFWTTSRFGYFSASRDTSEINQQSFQYLGDSSQVEFFGTKIINKQTRYMMGTKKSKIGRVLGIKYPFLYGGVNIKKVKLLQGKVLGLIKYSTTSVGMIPLGKGKIVIFGGFIPSASYAKIIAKDISQIIVSGVLSGKIELYKQGSLVLSTQTNPEGNYSLSTRKGIYDILFKIPDFSGIFPLLQSFSISPPLSFLHMESLKQDMRSVAYSRWGDSSFLTTFLFLPSQSLLL